VAFSVLVATRALYRCRASECSKTVALKRRVGRVDPESPCVARFKQALLAVSSIYPFDTPRLNFRSRLCMARGKEWATPTRCDFSVALRDWCCLQQFVAGSRFGSDQLGQLQCDEWIALWASTGRPQAASKARRQLQQARNSCVAPVATVAPSTNCWNLRQRKRRREVVKEKRGLLHNDAISIRKGHKDRKRSRPLNGLSFERTCCSSSIELVPSFAASVPASHVPVA